MIGCPIVKLPEFRKLNKLSCYGCNMLTNIPRYVKNLSICNCRLITYINPSINIVADVDSLIKMYWLYPNKKIVMKVIFLQKWFKKYIMIEKLIRLIPEIEKIYMAPGMKGCKNAEKKFNSIFL